MTRPRHMPDLGKMLRDLTRRVGALERAGRDVITPVSTAAATINHTSAQTPYMGLVNPSGATLTWWVVVTPATGTTCSLQLRASDDVVGHVVDAPSDGPNIVAVSMDIPSDWDIGTQMIVYLDAWIDVNSATVVPVRALIS